MKPKTMVLMMVAVGCGLVASYMTSKLIADRGSNQEPRIKVLVAKKKLKMLTALNKPEELFMEKELPLEAVPKKAVKSFEELKDKRLNKTLTEESLVTTDDLISKDLVGLQGALAPGQRATALKVNPESLAGGFILPGSRVDVVSTTNDGEAVSQIILQDMLVLAVDLQSNYDPTEKGPAMLGNTVTLAATPEEALRLSLAGRLGELRLLLRGIGDNAKVLARGSKRGDLNRPIRGSSDMQNNDNQLTQASTPAIPPLPPVPGDPPANPMQDMTEPQEDPLKTHKLTIISGDTQTTHTFVQEKDGTWKVGGSDRKHMDGGDDLRPVKPKAGWPKVGVPAAEKKDEPRGVDPDPRPLTVPEIQRQQLLQNSGLPLPTGNAGK